MRSLLLKKVPVGEEVKSLRIEVRYDALATFGFIEAHDQALNGPLWGDSKGIREEFEAVEDEREMALFLKRCGQFNPVGRAVDWAMFQKWQRYLRAQRLGEPLGIRTEVGSTPEGFGDNEILKTLVGRPDVKIIRKPSTNENDVQLKAWIECTCALEAIAAANFIDRLAGKEPRRCLECRKIFEPPTKRRHYCSQKCTDKACRQGKRLDSRGRQINTRGRIITTRQGRGLDAKA